MRVINECGAMLLNICRRMANVTSEPHSSRSNVSIFGGGGMLKSPFIKFLNRFSSVVAWLGSLTKRIQKRTTQLRGVR